MSELRHLVVVGASAGGVAALRTLLAGLSPAFAWPVAIVLHTRGDHVDTLARLLGERCPLPVREAGAGLRIENAQIYIAPGGYHLLVEHAGHFSLSADEKVCFVRPSADVLFSSAADACGAGVIGVVLTGTNEDGARGLAEIRARGGRSYVQDPQEAEEPAMPQAALRIAGADAVLTLDALARRLNQECLRP